LDPYYEPGGIRVFKKRKPAPQRRQDSEGNRADFEDLFGVWTDEEAEEFLNSISDLETVESERNPPDPCG
jgi:hypothetical protein